MFCAEIPTILIVIFPTTFSVADSTKIQANNATSHEMALKTKQ
jgi:hypothetical protein